MTRPPMNDDSPLAAIAGRSPSCSPPAKGQRRKPRATAEDAILGARIRTHRLAAGRSQEWLAVRIGVTFQQVQKYERGIDRVSALRLATIAWALEVPVAELLKDF